MSKKGARLPSFQDFLLFNLNEKPVIDEYRMVVHELPGHMGLVLHLHPKDDQDAVKTYQAKGNLLIEAG